MKRIIAIILSLSLILSAPIMSSQVKAAQYPTKAEIIGKWYFQDTLSGGQSWDPIVVHLNADGTFYRYNKYDDKKDIELAKSASKTYTYNEKTGVLTYQMPFAEGTYSYIFEKSNKTGIILLREVENKRVDYKGSMNYYLLGKQFKSFKSSYDYYRIKANDEGFYIKKKTLIKYVGTKKKVTVPEDVKCIGKSAFEIIPGYHPKTKKVIVPGTCKTIKKEAFSFSHVKTLVLKEGVKKLGYRCLSDTYWKKIYFPKSLKKVGKELLDTEEGLPNTKIYVFYKSKMGKYFRKADNKPYGRIRVKYRRK